jgi:hypothetical protein
MRMLFTPKPLLPAESRRDQDTHSSNPGTEMTIAFESEAENAIFIVVLPMPTAKIN